MKVEEAEQGSASPENASSVSSSKKRKHEEATPQEKHELFLHSTRNPHLKQVRKHIRTHCSPTAYHVQFRPILNSFLSPSQSPLLPYLASPQNTKMKEEEIYQNHK